MDMPHGAPDDVMHPLRMLWLGLMMWHVMMMVYPFGGMMEPSSFMTLAFSPRTCCTSRG
jgi:hypothetical protein